VGYEKQVLRCLVLYSSLFNFQREESDGNGKLVSHYVVVTNKL
jgi:hypothetical protein